MKCTNIHIKEAQKFLAELQTQFFNSCENSSRGGMEIFLEIHVLMIREIFQQKNLECQGRSGI